MKIFWQFLCLRVWIRTFRKSSFVSYFNSKIILEGFILKTTAKVLVSFCDQCFYWQKFPLKVFLTIFHHLFLNFEPLKICLPTNKPEEKLYKYINIYINKCN